MRVSKHARFFNAPPRARRVRQMENREQGIRNGEPIHVLDRRFGYSGSQASQNMHAWNSF